MKLSGEETRLLYLFAGGSSLCRCATAGFGGDITPCFHGQDEVDKFIHEFDSDPTKWRAEIAPSRPEAMDQRDVEGG